MKSYKNTLNLPNTTFPMKGNLPIQEPKILQKWEKNNIYHIIQNNMKKKKIFLLQDGPPYANGNIHIGHAVNKILKDIIIKSKTLSGFHAPYTPFWDCHGLPIEHKIETMLQQKKKNINKNIFRHLCQKYAYQQVQKQKKDFIRLGIFSNWADAQLTMDPQLEYNVIDILSKIIQNKHLYQGSKPVHWCIKCQSALAEAEVEYRNIPTISITVMFQIATNNDIYKIFPEYNKEINLYIIIWTTTPWSLPANRAIAVHPQAEYQIIQFKENQIIIAKNLVNITIQKMKIKKWNIITTIQGKYLENLIFHHPFLNIKIPIILSTHVSLETGTGSVHIAPDYGEEDYLISKKYGIKITNIINSTGKYTKNIHPELDEQDIFKSNSIIINLLTKKKLLFNSFTIHHTYPHCWRHKKPLIYRTTKQWFLKIQNSQLKKNILHMIKTVKWMPNNGYNNISTMLINRPDWCISRQRSWGVPITVFINKKTGELHPDTINIIEKIKKSIAIKGSRAWWELNKKEILGDDYKKYTKSKDVLDVWFESGCIYNLNIYQLNNTKNINNMYLEGCDQYRGWFMSSLIISSAIHKKTPYQEVLTHGFVIDHTGTKMSKSIGNTIVPSTIIKTFGADILRLWVASTNYTNDIIISHDTIKNISEQYRRIRNTIRFILGNIYDFNYKKDKINFSHMILLDQWILNKTKKLQKEIIYLYENYQFHIIVKKIIKFCSKEMGAFYFDIIKDRQYTNPKNSHARKSCQTAMYYILQTIVRWITPILPFTADEIWNYLPHNKDQFIFTTQWFKLSYSLPKIEIINHEVWNILIKIKTETNQIIEQKIKNKSINNSLQSIIILYTKKYIYNLIIMLKNEIKFMLLTSAAKIKDYSQSHNENCYKSKIPGLKISVKKYIGVKCNRCWHYFNHTYIKNINKDICNRCNKNLNENGEKRQFL
ncbi:Isoleucine--tRNA ligase [Buchnera aphidicola (Pterocallis alni)]|uniref:isoleucine--tRNA ligase n=1 Tax=Buchnera aphidicola TaxID=9 RepID=UPI0034646C2A